MNSENSKTADPYRLLFNLTDNLLIRTFVKKIEK